MVERLKPKVKREGAGIYFRPEPASKFISSGSTLLDCVNGGGWPLGRIANIVGDKSTGKTLLAIEAFANFTKAYPKGKMFYRESEAAFDPGYAESIGMPVSKIDFGDKGQRWTLIEDVYADLKAKAEDITKNKVPGIYVVDSLDALSTKIDMEREFGAQTYRTDKPTQLGELFRKLTTPIEDAQMLLIIISQVRAKIGVAFGDKTSRSGGGALDFYASIVNKLAHIKQIKETRGGIERVTSVRIKVKNTKNKVAEAFRDCEFDIRFGYGINDFASCLSWLIEIGRLDALELTKDKAKSLLKFLDKLDQVAIDEWGDEIKNTTRKVWADIDVSFRPPMRKY